MERTGTLNGSIPCDSWAEFPRLSNKSHVNRLFSLSTWLGVKYWWVPWINWNLAWFWSLESPLKHELQPFNKEDTWNQAIVDPVSNSSSCWNRFYSRWTLCFGLFLCEGECIDPISERQSKSSSRDLQLSKGIMFQACVSINLLPGFLFLRLFQSIAFHCPSSSYHLLRVINNHSSIQILLQ